jgi:SAM-dependent methyltransferase
MADVIGHYKNLLAAVYSWMAGGEEEQIKGNRSFFKANGVIPFGCREAVDLGCGSGFQSIPLAENGFRVTAIDLSDTLLAELETRRNGLEIIPVHADLRDFAKFVPERVELVVCMGDTLTHLSGLNEIERLIRDIYDRLVEGGKLVLGFRNFMQELPREARTIPVRSDDATVFTCFLEYEEGHVVVNDVLYTRGVAGWELKKSFYKKLRLDPEKVLELLKGIGYHNSTLREERGIATIMAVKP